MRVIGTMVGASLLTGCQVRFNETNEANAIEPTAANTTVVTAIAKLNAATPANTAAPAKAEAPALVLSGDGLSFVDAASGAARALPFGSDQAVAMTAVGASQGQSSGQGSNEDCGAGPVGYAHFTGLSLSFLDGKFVGWSANADAHLTTASGVGLGTARKALESVYKIQVDETSLGTEFNAGGLSGVIEDSKVSALWAGETCIAR